MMVNLVLGGNLYAKIHRTTQVLVTPASSLADRLVRGADVHQIILSPKDIERFWSKVAIGDPDECWEWQGPVKSTGYGNFSAQGNQYSAHRVAWVIHGGLHSGQFFILHSCDNRRCVNPRHLRPGTAKDNADDAVIRGRSLRGETNGNVRLTSVEVRNIRASYAREHTTKAALAREYGIGVTQVSRIVRRVNWKHVP